MYFVMCCFSKKIFFNWKINQIIFFDNISKLKSLKKHFRNINLMFLKQK
jgi:hypothetical protein